MTSAAARARDESDLVILELVRLASAEPWQLDGAARRLLSKRHHVGALRVAQTRVDRVRADRDSRIAARSAAVLRAALLEMAAAPSAP